MKSRRHTLREAMLTLTGLASILLVLFAIIYLETR